MKDPDQSSESQRASVSKSSSAKKRVSGPSSEENPIFSLHRKAGNRAVAQALTSDVIQRKPKDSSGVKTVHFQVIWTEDDSEFYRRVVAAIARQSGIPQHALWQGVYGPAHRLHARLMKNLELRPGRPVKVTARVAYDPSTVADIQELEPAATPAAATPTQTPTSEPQLADEDLPKPRETTEQRLRRQARTTARVLSREVADADARGWASINIKIEHNGEELLPGFEKLGPQTARPSGTVPVSAEDVLREHLKPELEMILMSGKGIYQIQFARNAQGRMTFFYFGRFEPPSRGRGLTEREELDALGIPDRRKIYAQIFAEAEQVLKEEAIKAAGFTAEQIALWIAGGAIIRVLGVLGAGAARGFPILARALRLRRTGNIVKAIASLGEAEGAEFTSLMEQSQKGRLAGQHLTRLGELMAKIERALGVEAPFLRTVSRISESPALVREAEAIGADAQREIDNLLEQYLKGNKSPGIGTKALDKGIFYLRGRNGGRIFLRETGEGYLEILGKADKSNEETVINAILKLF